MLSKTHKPKNGFTIIEIMIVLAIAGLIMLIVFLAVPALQRSARNTQRKNDASAIATAIANYIDNNGGTVPNGVAEGSGASDLVVCSTAGTNTETATLAYYAIGASTTCSATSGNVSINAVTTLTSPTVTQNTVVIETGENCNDTGTAAGQLTSRSAAIFYGLESNSSNSVTTQCIEQ